MTTEDLALGNQLNSVIDYYGTVLTELADDTKKEKALYALLSSGNAVVAVLPDEADYITGLRDAIITDLITEITARKADKQDEFDNLATIPVT